MAIQLFVPTFHTDECLEEIRECLDKGWTGIGYKTIQIEEKWKEYTGLPNAHFLNSATAGLHLAVKILKMENGWNDGDEIISSPVTFCSSNHAILYEDMTPVFADVDEHLCIDPEDVEGRITQDTRAIMFIGYGGNIGRYYDIVDICKRRNLKLIADFAHCSGTRYKGMIPGKEADCVVYSYQAVKNLCCADAGMICFKEKKYDELARKLSWMGISRDTYLRSSDGGSYKWKYNVDYVGYKFHGNSVMASILLVQLKYLDSENIYRRQISEWYDNNFKGINKIKPIPVIEGCESSRHLYVIEVNNRDELMMALNKDEIYPGVHYVCNTEYKMYSYLKGTCPNAERMQERILTLPIHLRLTKEDVDFVSSKVIEHAK